MRADTATSYSSSGDILRAHALARRLEQLQSAKQNVLCLWAVAGGRAAEAAAGHKAQVDFRGVLCVRHVLSSRLGC